MKCPSCKKSNWNGKCQRCGFENDPNKKLEDFFQYKRREKK